MIRPSVNQLIFENASNYTALSSFTSEANLLAGQSGERPAFPPLYFNMVQRRTFRVLARGIVGSTGTPTFTITIRLGTSTTWATTDSQIGITQAITTASGISNKWWELNFQMTCTIQGLGSNNMTLSGSGSIRSPGGFASPFEYAIEPTAPDTATWTVANTDGALVQYLGLSATCSVSDASNTIQVKQLYCYGEN